MQNLSAWLPALLGFAIGAVAGFAVRHAKLCSFGAIEDALSPFGVTINEAPISPMRIVDLIREAAPETYA